MQFFSKKGQSSTPLEKFLFLGILVALAVVVVPNLKVRNEHTLVFSKAAPSVLVACQQKSNYNPWRFWSTQRDGYQECILNTKDPEVLNAAGKYLLGDSKGEFVESPKKDVKP